MTVHLYRRSIVRPLLHLRNNLVSPLVDEIEKAQLTRPVDDLWLSVIQAPASSDDFGLVKYSSFCYYVIVRLGP